MKRKQIALHAKNHLVRLSIVPMIMLFCFQLLNANENKTLIQDQRTVSGIVTDSESGEPLPGVSVLIKGTTVGTITNVDGFYEIQAASVDVLEFSFIGYLSEEISVGDQAEINISLVQDIIGMDEVVVVGYGVQKKKLVTGATSQVKSEDLVAARATRIESSLQGLTPGMTIVKKSGQPGSGYNINIRGLGSINGSEPLVLIDGVPGSLEYLNPNDVESVDVLKDAASAAIYGSRAADGVILVTTKKGKSGKANVVYDFHYGISNPPTKIDVLNGQEYTMIMNEANENANRDPFFTQDQIDAYGEGTNWQEEAVNTNAPSQSHYLGISGGTDISTYSMSLSYDSEEGIFDYEGKSKYDRFGFRINSEHKPKEYLTVGQNLTYTHRNVRGLGVGNIYGNFMFDLLQSSPIIKAYDETVYDGFGRSDFQEAQINPIASMHYNYNDINKYDDLIGDIYAEVRIIEGLKFRTDIGAHLSVDQFSNATDTFTLTPQTYRAIPNYQQRLARRVGYNWDNVLSYDFNVADHQLMLMIGTNVQDNWFYNVEGKKEGFLTSPTSEPVLDNVTDLDTLYAYGDNGKGDARLSFFGRINYNYKEKYLATATLRRDASSRFGQENRIGYFPSLSAGWVISEESFLENAGFLDYLKLRVSWGQNGKEPSQPYQYLATVGADNRYYNYGDLGVGISPTKYPNKSLRWESSEQINIGFDSRFLRNFRFTFDWYKKTSKDWIIQVQVPGLVGLAGISNEDPFVNAGNVVNTGVEFELGYANSFGDLFLDVNANYSYNKNTVTEVPGEFISGSGSVLYNGSDIFYEVREDFPIGYFFGYKTDGIFQTEEEVLAHTGSNGDVLQASALPGDVRRVNVNGDSIIDDADKVMLGSPHPDFLYGLNIYLSWKGLDFGMNIMGQGGHQIVKSYRAEERFYNNYTTQVLDRWTGPGTSDRIPRVTLSNEPNQNYRRFSDLYVYDADFMRIRNISLGYDLMQLFDNAPLQKFRIYFAATNILTVTKYDGLDPEIGYGSYYGSDGNLQDAYASGIDIGFYPSAVSYLFGINVTF